MKVMKWKRESRVIFHLHLQQCHIPPPEDSSWRHGCKRQQGKSAVSEQHTIPCSIFLIIGWVCLLCFTILYQIFAKHDQHHKMKKGCPETIAYYLIRETITENFSRGPPYTYSVFLCQFYANSMSKGLYEFGTTFFNIGLLPLSPSPPWTQLKNWSGMASLNKGLSNCCKIAE